MDAEAAVKLLRQIGFYELSGMDGCLCGSILIQDFSIDVSCRKSSGSLDFFGNLIRVHSGYMGVTPADLLAVAVEMVKQIHEHDDWSPIRVRFCDYNKDSKQLCVYCDKPRSDKDGYLCESCLVKDDPFRGKVRDEFDYRVIEGQLVILASRIGMRRTDEEI